MTFHMFLLLSWKMTRWEEFDWVNNEKMCFTHPTVGNWDDTHLMMYKDICANMQSSYGTNKCLYIHIWWHLPHLSWFLLCWTRVRWETCWEKTWSRKTSCHFQGLQVNYDKRQINYAFRDILNYENKNIKLTTILM